MGVVRKTRSVNLILEAFHESENAISIVELVKRFKNKMNKTTVYRVLERLEDGGILHSFTGKDGLKWMAKRKNSSNASDQIDVHPHFQCNACGKSECLPVDIKLPEVPKYRIEAANYILIGQCEECIS